MQIKKKNFALAKILKALGDPESHNYALRIARERTEITNGHFAIRMTHRAGAVGTATGRRIDRYRGRQADCKRKSIRRRGGSAGVPAELKETMLRTHVGKFNVPQLTPEPMAIGRTWIRVGDEWFSGRDLAPETVALLDKSRMNHDSTIGVTWFRWSIELATTLGVKS